jgi:hypothetical protein
MRYEKPLADLSRVVLFTAAGISPFIIAAAAYQIFKERDVKNIFMIWLVAYGVFVLARTPQSHEYYSLPAILAGAGIIGVSQKFKVSTTLLVLIVIVLALPSAYVLLSYSGDAGYTATKDVGVFLKSYMDEHPDNEYLVLVQEKYTPQMAWYSGGGIF